MSVVHHTYSDISGTTFLGQVNQKMQYNFFGHLMSLAPAPAPTMASLHLFTQGIHNKVQYALFGHVMALGLALASSDVDSVINGITAFLRSG